MSWIPGEQNFFDPQQTSWIQSSRSKDTNYTQKAYQCESKEKEEIAAERIS